MASASTETYLIMLIDGFSINEFVATIPVRGSAKGVLLLYPNALNVFQTASLVPVTSPDVIV